jgi:interferon, gamma-inducible protein 30
MASSSRASLLAALLLFSTLSLNPLICSAKDSKVSLALYYETLCPYSANFIVNYLAGIFDNGLISVVDLDLIPYGNARVSSNGTITCQVSLFLVSSPLFRSDRIPNSPIFVVFW